MSSITPNLRMWGWNVKFLATSTSKLFAGLYQDPTNLFLIFCDLVDELRLSFEDDQNWNGIAFGLDKAWRSSGFPLFITQDKFDTVIPGLPSADPDKEPASVKYHVVRHGPCHLPEDSPLEDHLKASCATHMRYPIRRHDPRYLAPGATSSDDQVAQMPSRRKQSPKRKRASAASPDKDPEDASESLISVSEIIDPAKARRIMASFRPAVIASGKRCAVTGEGRPWWPGPPIGPSLQACHIVPQQHFHVYPTGDDITDFSDRRLAQAWCDTWDSQNGLLLFSNIHEFFDSRLLSIHPDTHRIRAFVPYDALLRYHGNIATIPGNVDREALAHHYEMACIKNMAAKMQTPGSSTQQSTAATSSAGTPFSCGSTPFSARPDLPATPGPAPMGDPSKRARPSEDKGGPNGANDHDERHSKRHRGNADSIYGYITPANSQKFLAEVNSKLVEAQESGSDEDEDGMVGIPIEWSMSV